MAFVGGMITVDDNIYKKILGLLLIVPIVSFLFFANIKVEEIKKSNIFLSLLIGAAIGFLSGLIGIGGGIILSPVLLLLKWTDMKQTAAISAIVHFCQFIVGPGRSIDKGYKFQPRHVSLCSGSFCRWNLWCIFRLTEIQVEYFKIPAGSSSQRGCI